MKMVVRVALLALLAAVFAAPAVAAGEMPGVKNPPELFFPVPEEESLPEALYGLPPAPKYLLSETDPDDPPTPGLDAIGRGVTNVGRIPTGTLADSGARALVTGGQFVAPVSGSIAPRVASATDLIDELQDTKEALGF